MSTNVDVTIAVKISLLFAKTLTVPFHLYNEIILIIITEFTFESALTPIIG